MTDNEIIKALECCIKSSHFGECFENKCPMVSEKGCKVGKEGLYPYALDLINRQKAEIERLKEKINTDNELLNVRVQESVNSIEKANKRYTDTLEIRIADLTDELQCYKETNEHLNNEYTALSRENDKLKAVLEEIENDINPLPFVTDFDIAIRNAKSEAIKEFANKVEQKCLDRGIYPACVKRAVEETKREMTEKDDD